MAEEVTIVIKGDDRASKPIDDAAKSLGSLEEKGKGAASATKDAGAAVDGAGAAAGKMSPAMMAAGVAVTGVAVAAAAAAAAVGGLIAIIQAGTDAFREQDAVNRGLEQSLRAAGFAGEPLSDAIAGIDESIGQLAKSTMFGDEELKRMATSFMLVSGESEVTREQMSLMADMAHGMGISTDAAGKLMAQAMKGDLPKSLATTTSLTKDQIAAINALEDPTARAQAAQALLSETFGGAAENINGYYRATKNLEDAKGDLLQKIGEVWTETGALEPVFDAVTSALNSMEGWIDANKETIQEFVIDGVAMAIDAVTSLIEKLQFISPVLATVATAVRVAVNQWDNLYQSLRIVGDGMTILRSEIIGRLLQALSALLGGVAKVAGFFSKDLGAAIDKASAKAREFADASFEVSDKAFGSIEQRAGKIAENVGDIVEAVKEWPATNDRINAGLGAAAGYTRKIADQTRAAKDNLGKVRDELNKMPSVNGAEDLVAEAPSAGRADNGEAERLAALEREEALRNRIASTRLAALREVDPIQRAALEMTARELELEQRKLTEMERELEQARINADFARAIAQADDDSHKAAMDRIAEERAAKEQILQIEQDRIAAVMAYNDEMLGGLDKILPGLGSLSAGLANVQDLQWGTKEATDSMTSAMSGLATAGGAISSLIAKDKKAAAKVEVGFQAAAAVGAFAAFAASGFTAVPLGIAAAQHAIAAGKFAAVAGGGGGSGARPSASSAGASGSSVSRDRAVAQQGATESRGDTIINIDLGSSTNLRSAVDTGREIATEVASAQRNEFRL